MDEEKKELVVGTFENAEGTSNEIGVLDEIGIDMLKNQLVSLYAEEDAFLHGLKNAEDGKKNYVDQWLVDEELLDMQLENFGMKEESKTHLIHDLPRFWELQKQQFGYKVRHEKFQAKNQIAGYDREIETANNQLEHIRGKIKDLTVQLEELGEEVPLRKEDVKND